MIGPSSHLKYYAYFRKRGVNPEVSETTNKVLLNMLRCILKLGGHDVSSCLMLCIVLEHFLYLENIKRYIQVD